MAAAGMVAFASWRIASRAPGPESGAIASRGQRQTVVLGRRGAAVAEAGAALSWISDGRGAVVSQSAGDVFYRVERGGPFRVDTPYGAVRVTGTCFRVELDMKPGWQAIAGAAVGAAVVVTVYEGRVLFAGRGGGGETPVEAGQQLRASGDGSASVGEAGGAAAVAEAPAPPDRDASREELLRRDQVQRAEIGALRLRVRELESGAAVRVTGGPRSDPRDPSGRPWFDPTHDDLVRFAAECRVRMDMPPIFSSDPLRIGPVMAKQWGLSDEERVAVNRVLASIHQRYLAQLRAMYVEITGDSARADDLSPQGLASELRDKSPAGEAERVNQKIARERAGLARPPADLSKLSPLERFIRLEAGLGDQTEREVGAAIGRDRARAIREQQGGWGMRSERAGCPDKGGADVELER